MTIDEFIAALDTETAPPASESDIAAFEALVGHPLPGDYRAFLGRSGGGCFGAMSPMYRLGRMEEAWSRVSGLRPDPSFSIEHEFRRYGFGPLPRGVIWIGDDGSGNPIALSLRPDRLGEVFIIDHEICAFEGESEAIEQAESYGLAISAAPSFTALVASLVAEDEDDDEEDDQEDEDD